MRICKPAQQLYNEYHSLYCGLCPLLLCRFRNNMWSTWICWIFLDNERPFIFHSNFFVGIISNICDCLVLSVQNPQDLCSFENSKQKPTCHAFWIFVRICIMSTLPLWNYSIQLHYANPRPGSLHWCSYLVLGSRQPDDSGDYEPPVVPIEVWRLSTV